MGGSWTAQNKTLPGTYINYRGTDPLFVAESDRGKVGIPIMFPWLPEQQLVAITAKDAGVMLAEYGEAARPIYEAAKNASIIQLYRLNKGVAASITLTNLKATALYSGIYGNRFSVSVEAISGSEGKYYVVTWFGSIELERQMVAAISALQPNKWLTFAKVGSEDTLVADAGKPLAGGTDGNVTTTEHVKELEAFETAEINAIACPSNDSDIKALYVAFAKRMVADEGKFLQVVVPDCDNADHETIISVKNGVRLGDLALTNVQCTPYIAGATAACPLTRSLSGAVYAGATDVDQRYTTSQQETLARTGQMVFLPPVAGSNTVTVLNTIESLINGVIDRINGLIEFANKIPGVSIDVVDNVSFGAEAAVKEEAARAARAAKLAESKAAIVQKAADRDSQLSDDAVRWRAEAEAKQSETDAPLDDPYVMSDYSRDGFSLDGGSLDKVGSIGKAVDISDQSLQYLNDIAEVELLESLESTSALQLSKSDSELMRASAEVADTNIYYIQYTGGVKIRNDVTNGTDWETMRREMEDESQREIEAGLSGIEEVIYSG